MQIYLELSNEDPIQWVKLASSYLQKDASLWWNSYLNSNLLRSYSTIKWEEFVEALLKRFRPIANEEHAIGKLQKWKQMGNLESYIRGFSNIQTLIPYSLMPEGMRVILFTNNLLPHLQRYVRQCKASTLQDAIVYAREGADTFKSSTNPTNFRTVTQPLANRNSHRNMNSNQNKRYSLGDTQSHPIQIDNTEMEESNYYNGFNETDYNNYSEISSNINNNDATVLESYNMLLAALPPDLVKLYKDGRCFHCKSKGHRRDRCPQLVSNKSSSSSIDNLKD